MKNIYVYDINNLELINKKPFRSKLECSNNLKITRGSILKYIETGEIFKYKYLFSYHELDKKEILKRSIYKEDTKIWEIITGELLGDGHIRLQSKDTARLEFTFSSKIIHYVNYLKYNVLSEICNDNKPTPWPKNNPTQYWFSSKSMSILKEIHSKWYKWDKNQNKYIKIIPKDIANLITPISIAHWTMGDGYYDTWPKTIIYCTDSFSKNDILLLINILNDKFNIKSDLKIRNYYNKNNQKITHYRLKVNKSDINKLINLIKPFMIPEMFYKLGIK